MFDDVDPILAGGNDNWEWQLRDTDGRWVYMGGLARFFARLANGKIGSGVGKVVKITSPTQALVQVDPKNGGEIPGGEYLVNSDNLHQASAIIPERTLRKMGVKFNPPTDSSTIPNLSDMRDAGRAAASANSGDDGYGSPSFNRVPNISQVRDPYEDDMEDYPEVSVTGWEQISSSDYLKEKQDRAGANLFDDIVNGRPDIVSQYKEDYGSDWEDQLRKDVRAEYQNFVFAQAEEFFEVDLYRLGNVTVAVSKEFRADPDRLEAMLDQIRNLRKNTRDIDKPIEITILAHSVEGEENYSGFARSTLVSFVDDSGNPIFDRGSMSMIIDASALLSSNERARTDLLRTLEREKDEEDGTHSFSSAYGGDVDTYIEYTIAHEWGHMLDYAADGDNDTKSVQFNGESFQASQLSGRLAALLEKHPWIFPLLSRYGQSDPYEAFAELFAQVYMEKFRGAGIDSKIPNALRLFIEKYVL